MRIGHGYDVHRLVSGRPLYLGGIQIPYEFGLDGHSDADVLIHAVMDALLGAAAMPDIGALFPPNDDRYLNIRSTELLSHVAQKLRENHWQVVNIDATVIAQRPKLLSFIPAMRVCIAGLLNISFEDVNVKATTEEKLGFTGRGEGIAAHAVCLIEKEYE